MKRNWKSRLMNKKNSIVKLAVFFVVLTSFLISTAYALSNQLFTISGNVTIVNYGDCPTGVDFTYEVVSSWGDSTNGYTYQARLNVKNNSNERITGWTITLKGPTDLSFNYIGAEATIDNGEATITPTGNYTWAANVEIGETRSIDFQINTAESSLELEYLYFDSCMVVAGSENAPLRDFSVDPTQLNLKTNQTGSVTIYKMPADARANFTFSSDNTSIATVSANGEILGVAPGTTTVRISSGGITRTVQVVVTDEQVVLTSLSLSPKENQMKIGDEKTLTTTKVPADAGTAVTYTSSNNDVATVDSSGKVTAIGVGTAVITASASGISDTANVTVIRDAISEDIDASFSYQYYDSNNIQFIINLTNIGHSEIHKITFKISFPTGTVWSYWNNYPALFVADSTGTILTSTGTYLALPTGSYINFTGNVTLPNGYNSADYLSPTIYDIEVEG